MDSCVQHDHSKHRIWSQVIDFAKLETGKRRSSNHSSYEYWWSEAAEVQNSSQGQTFDFYITTDGVGVGVKMRRAKKVDLERKQLCMAELQYNMTTFCLESHQDLQDCHLTLCPTAKLSYTSTQVQVFFLLKFLA